MIATPPPTPCQAPLVFAQMRTALGGAAWRRAAETTAWGSASLSGLRGTARFDDDLVRGRYTQRFQVAVVGANAEIYDGSTVWAQDISGGVHPLDSAFPRAAAVTAAYLTSRAYLEPSTSPTPRCTAGGDGQAVRIVVRPRGGIPAELTVGAKSHLLESISERLPLTTSVTRYGDYRQVNGLVLPFEITSGTKAEPADGFAVHVQRYRVLARAVAADFARPAAVRYGHMLGNASATTVPLRLEGRQLLVWAAIDGHAPMPFILDTGGHAILTTGAAKALGLQAHGAGESGGSGAGTISLQYTRVKSVRIGNAELRDQPFLVIPYPYSFYERGRRTPLAGILGLEVFEAFATRIDYAGRRLSLTPLERFAYRGAGTAVPFHFQDDMPMVEAAADGHAGLFGTDTGNAGSLILFGDFLKRTGLLARYSGGYAVRGFGTGGSNTGRLGTLRTFELGGHTLSNVATDFTQMQSGAFSSWTEAGNLGYEVLWRFIPTFDYAHERLYLDASPRAQAPPQNRTGLAVMKNEPANFQVVMVRPGSAAAKAGIQAGDRIVAIDGKEASGFSRADLVDLATGPAGTRLELRVRRAAQTRSAILVLP